MKKLTDREELEKLYQDKFTSRERFTSDWIWSWILARDERRAEEINDYWVRGIERTLEVVPASDKTMVFVMPLTAWNTIKDLSKKWIKKYLSQI